MHTLYYALANYEDRVHGEVSRTRDPVIISHKVEAISLLRQAIAMDAFPDPAVLIATIIRIMRSEPGPNELQANPRCLFDPHLPMLNSIHVYGRGTRRADPRHASMILSLVDKLGGPYALPTKGLAKEIAA
jgi:hypothetical protein